MGFDNVNVNVCGGQSIIKALQNYNTVILKPNIVDNRNVLTQEMMSERHTKYIIRWNYSLEGATINVPEDCIIEFAGGTIDNGVIVGNNTRLIYSKPIDEICKAEKRGTWIYDTSVADEEDITSVEGHLKFKDRPATDGMGRKILRKNIVNGVNTLTQSMINQADTIYVIQYDFTLGEDIIIPANCVLEFDGGSVSNGHVISNGTILKGGFISSKECFISVFYNEQGKPLDYNLEEAGDYNFYTKYATITNVILADMEIESDWNCGVIQSLCSDDNYIYVFHAAYHKSNRAIEFIRIVLYDRLFNRLGTCVITNGYDSSTDTVTGTSYHANDCTIYNNYIYICLTYSNGILILDKNLIIQNCLNNIDFEAPVQHSDKKFTCIDYDKYTNTFYVVGSQGGIYDTNLNLIKSVGSLQTAIQASLNSEYQHVTIQSVLFRRGVVYHHGWFNDLSSNNSSPVGLISIADVKDSIKIVLNQAYTKNSSHQEAEGIYWDDVYNAPICGFNYGGMSINVLQKNTELYYEDETIYSPNHNIDVYVDNTYTGFSCGTSTYPYKTLGEAFCLNRDKKYITLHCAPTNKPYNLNSTLYREHLQIHSSSGKATIRLKLNLNASYVSLHTLNVSSLDGTYITKAQRFSQVEITSCICNSSYNDGIFIIQYNSVVFTRSNNNFIGTGERSSQKEGNLIFNIELLAKASIYGNCNCNNVVVFKTGPSSSINFSSILPDLFVLDNSWFINGHNLIKIPRDSNYYTSQFYQDLLGCCDHNSIEIEVTTSFTSGYDNGGFIRPDTYKIDVAPNNIGYLWRSVTEPGRSLKVPNAIRNLEKFNNFIKNNSNIIYSEFKAICSIVNPNIITPVSVKQDGTVLINGHSPAINSGNSNSRPIGQHLEGDTLVGSLISTFDAGFQYFDTTLGKPIYAKSIDATTGEVTWVDATGTTV